jgi:hypothetical protein
MFQRRGVNLKEVFILLYVQFFLHDEPFLGKSNKFVSFGIFGATFD